LYSMYALGSVYLDDNWADCNPKAGDFYYDLAKKEINELKVEVADYHTIGACLLLFKYCKGMFGYKWAIKIAFFVAKV
jgi:hypothetical protein